MKQKVLELSRIKKNVSVYINAKDTSKFIFGRIICSDEEYFVARLLDPCGNYDGILVKEINEIVRIDSDDKYGKKIERLAEGKAGQDIELSLKGDNLVKEVLEKTRNENKIVSVEILHSGESDVIGFVESITENMCTIKQIDPYGEEDGVSHILLDDITELSYDSVHEDALSTLWKHGKE
jgi:hypothetical protein